MTTLVVQGRSYERLKSRLPFKYREGQANIATHNLIFWLVLDPITFGLGSIGGYILFREFVEHERLPRRDEWLPLLKRHWPALLSLAIAIGYFFYRLIDVLNA